MLPEQYRNCTFFFIPSWHIVRQKRISDMTFSNDKYFGRLFTGCSNFGRIGIRLEAITEGEELELVVVYRSSIDPRSANC